MKIYLHKIHNIIFDQKTNDIINITCDCDNDFDNLLLWEKHMKQELNLQLEKARQKHYLSHTNYGDECYVCRCGKEFEILSELNQHLKMEVV